VPSLNSTAPRRSGRHAIILRFIYQPLCVLAHRLSVLWLDPHQARHHPGLLKALAVAFLPFSVLLVFFHAADYTVS
jgi:hypothetical protein